MLRLENVAKPDVLVATGSAPERTPAPPCAVTLIVTPLTGLPPLSVTRTVTGGMIAPAAVFLGCRVKIKLAPAPPILLSAKFAAGVMPPTEAVTAKEPTAALATAVT